MRDLALILIFLLMSSTAGVQTRDRSGSSPPTRLETSNDPAVLHELILDRIGSRRYSEAAGLLEHLKKIDPARYELLPYSLLHAKAYALSENFDHAIELYKQIVENPEFTRYTAVPAARLAAARGNQQLAIYFYQKALRINDLTDYAVISREAMDYCWLMKRADDLKNIAQIVKAEPKLRRTAEFYAGKADLLNGDQASARAAFINLISASKKDDITSQALSELDEIEGGRLEESTALARGKLAYHVWNFELAAKYLAPYASRSIDESYLYARAISFLGESASAKKMLMDAAHKWPEDPMAKLCLTQYGNISLRNGNYQEAAEIFQRLRKPSSVMDDATIKLLFALRAQSKLKEARALLDPYARTTKKTNRHKAVFLRARTYFQSGLYRESLTDFDTLLKESSPNRKELMLWKGITLEKLGLFEDASNIYRSLAQGNDFFAFHAAEKLAQSGRKIELQNIGPEDYQLCVLPDNSNESKIIELKASGDLVPALLYLRLYEEAAQSLTTISASGWDLLGIDPSNRKQKFLSISYLAGLGENYPAATYYGDLFLKSLPDESSLFSASHEVLKALYPIPYREPVSRFSTERQLDPLFVLSIMKQESKFKRQARSPAFARGLMQLIPTTANKVASDLGIKNFSLEQLYHPEININLGTKYLKDLASRFGNKVEVMAAGYNSGESNVRRWLDCTSTDEILEFYSNIDLPETKNYVMIVKANYESYRRVYQKKRGEDSARLSSGLE
jgi:soluble lytic murein transglycosylase